MLNKEANHILRGVDCQPEMGSCEMGIDPGEPIPRIAGVMPGEKKSDATPPRPT